MKTPHGGITAANRIIPAKHAQGVPFDDLYLFKTPVLIMCSITLFKIHTVTPIIKGKKPLALSLFVHAKNVINNKNSMHGIIGKKLKSENMTLNITIIQSVDAQKSKGYASAAACCGCCCSS